MGSDCNQPTSAVGDSDPSDLELVRRANNGDLAAFESLTVRYERLVYSLARRMLQHEQDAQDVTQLTFLSVVEHLDQFRGDATFATWLMRIATYAALKVLRKRRNQIETAPLESCAETSDVYDDIAHPSFIADWSQSPEELVHRREISQLIEAALEQLDEKLRVVFILRDIEGLSIKETADALGLSEANVKVRLLRARLNLREQLTAAFGDQATRVNPGHNPPESKA
jgi:RNA polymerase sigma-70 factor, ECF subfamily